MEGQALWQRCKKGDREAFRQIYMDHIDALMAYGKKICPDTELLEDAAHDLFVYIWEKRESLGETDSIIRYLCASLRRRLVKDMAQSSKTQHPEHLENHSSVAMDSYESDWIDQENATKQQNALQAAMTRLPKRQQEALHLKYYQNMSYEEICTVMDINYQSVRNLISKGIIELRSFM